MKLIGSSDSPQKKEPMKLKKSGKTKKITIELSCRGHGHEDGRFDSILKRRALRRSVIRKKDTKRVASRLQVDQLASKVVSGNPLGNKRISGSLYEKMEKKEDLGGISCK